MAAPLGRKRTKEEILAIVRKELKDVEGYTDWGSDFPLSVNDVSGHGGTKTYVVTCEGNCKRPKVVFHGHGGSYGGEFYMRRMDTAQKVLNAAGLAPARLARGTDWWIEAFLSSGEVSDKDKDASPAQSVLQKRKGAFLRRVHEVDPSWFNEFRDEMRARDKRLAKVSDASHLWLYATRGCFGFDKSMEGITRDKDEEFDKWSEETMLRYADWTVFESRVPRLNEIVTLHGDYHAGNIVKDERAEAPAGVVDFEFTHAGPAIRGLAFALIVLGADEEGKKDFLRGYLEQMGYKEAEAEELLPTILEDCQRAGVVTWVAGFFLEGWAVQGMSGESLDKRMEYIHKGMAAVLKGETTVQEVKRNTPAEFPLAHPAVFEGTWRPHRHSEWKDPVCAEDSRTIEVWKGDGTGTWQGKEMQGTFARIEEDPSDPGKTFWVTFGPGPAEGWRLKCQMLPDGTRFWPEVQEYWKKLE